MCAYRLTLAVLLLVRLDLVDHIETVHTDFLQLSLKICNLGHDLLLFLLSLPEDAIKPIQVIASLLVLFPAILMYIYLTFFAFAVSLHTLGAAIINFGIFFFAFGANVTYFFS